jgi:hypothetical protein
MRRFLPLGTAFLLVVTACGAGSKPAPRLSNLAAHTRPSTHALAAAREREAGRKAEQLLRLRQELLTVAILRVAGGTDLRVDAGVGWTYPRAPSEVVPAGVRDIDIRDGRLARRVRDQAKVARIVRWFDALDVAPPTVHIYCPLILAARVTFVFRSAGGARLASAIVPSRPANACDSIAFSIHGHRQTPLVDVTLGRRAFVNRVQRLLGVCFRDPRRACR